MWDVSGTELGSPEVLRVRKFVGSERCGVPGGLVGVGFPSADKDRLAVRSL